MKAGLYFNLGFPEEFSHRVFPSGFSLEDAGCGFGRCGSQGIAWWHSDVTELDFDHVVWLWSDNIIFVLDSSALCISLATFWW